MIRDAFDTETTGLDLQHGVMPFLASFCDENWNNTWYEWDVDPLTRRVLFDKNDVEEIIARFDEVDEIILQNAKYDVTVMKSVLPKGYVWPWKKTRDTMMYGHLLASNHPHDLESMAIEWLGVDISAAEKHMQKVVTSCRSLVTRKNSPIHMWRIAQGIKSKQALPEMPSAKEKVWKFDLWLPRAIARARRLAEEGNIGELRTMIPDFVDHQENVNELIVWLSQVDRGECETVTAIYGNSDTATTLGIYKAQLKEIEHRKLGKIAERRQLLVPVIERVQANGVTINEKRRDELLPQYVEESNKANAICVNIAESLDYQLTLPKSGNNKSLIEFAFGPLELPAIKRSKKTGQPSLDAKVIEAYQVELPARSRQLAFVNALAAKRKRDTAISFLASYERFWLPTNDQFTKRLFPSLNPTATDTLRFGSNNPNEQNISKKEGFNLRYCFGPAPGREWWSLDAKNIELRLPAYESGEQIIIDLFEKPDEAPYYGSTHLLNFHTVYPDFWGEVYDDLVKSLGSKEEAWAKVGPTCKKKYAASWYQYVKNGGFAVQYGAVEESGTADAAFHREGSQALLKERFDKLEGLNQHWIDFAEEHGYVETMPDASVDPERGYPLLCTRSQWGKVKPTVPLNYHIQGTAMWWMCQAMIRCQEQLDAWADEDGFTGFITMQVHDELVFDFPRGKGSRPWMTNYEKIERLADIMAQGGKDIGVPTPVGIEYNGETWSEGKTLR